jgi:hypothetical protein
MPAPPEQIVKDIEILQGKVITIEAALEEMKRKARAGGKIPPAELQMAVKDIDQLKCLMEEQIKDGH